VDHPELLVQALLVVATKLAYPFQGISTSLGRELMFTPTFNWDVWTKNATLETDKSKHSLPDHGGVTAEKVATMNDEELDAYFSHVSSFIDRNNDNPITQLFPHENPLPVEASVDERSERDMDRLMPELLERIVSTTPNQPSRVDQLSDVRRGKYGDYELFRDIESLSGPAKAFYTAAGKIFHFASSAGRWVG
jgi:hypothetical protein